MLHQESESRRSGRATVLNRQTVRQDRRSSEKGCNIEKNLGFMPTYWGGFSITASRLCCQDASTEREYWHVMQPWATRAKRWCIEKKKSTQRILIYIWMSVKENVWHIARDSSRRPGVGGGRREWKSVLKTKCLLCRKKKLAGVFCTCQYKSLHHVKMNWERKVYGKVDERSEWGGISRLKGFGQ